MSVLLKPEPMQRILVLSSKGQQATVIETLHRLRVAHLIDFQSNPEAYEGFDMGAPLPTGKAASERLVRIRAILRHLGLEGAKPTRLVPVAEIERVVDERLDEIEREVVRAHESRDALRNSLQESRDLEAKLEPLRPVPLRLEDYRGYDALTVFTGRAAPAFEAEARAAAPDALLVKGAEGGVFAFFVPSAQAQAASEVLYRHGYAEVEVPEGTGTPDERLRALEQEREALARRAEQADAELRRLGDQHRDLLLAADEHLSIIVEKAEAPLAFASSDHAFVVDAWVPMAQAAAVTEALRAATDDNVYVQPLAFDPHAHDVGHHHDGADAQTDAKTGHSHDAGGHHHAPKIVPPTKYDNPKASKSYEWFTELFATPRYNEVDPTTIFAFFFPVFFGFMIGDLGLGLLIMGLGWLMIKKLKNVEGMKNLGTAFLAAGIVAAAFGGFVFKDALGVPLGVTHHMEDKLLAKGIDHPTCYDIYTYLHEPTWTCLFNGASHEIHYEKWAEPLVAKVTDVPSMLLLSVLAALVHITLGLLLGVKNELGHGAKHVAAKFGFLVLLAAFFPAAVALLRPDMFADAHGAEGLHAAVSFHIPITTTQAYMGAGIGALVGGVILGWAEGVAGILEIPSMLSAILSYLRLGAVAIAKGAMALAFNAMTLVAALTGLEGGNWLMFILGLIGFLVAQSALFVLGLLSGGIQALRLNFVEFFTKFYKGGGDRYKPFGRERQYSSSPSTQ